MLTTLFGTFGSIIIGFIFFGSSIFTVTNSAFQFVALGFYGALFFSLLEYRTVRDQIFGIIFIIILQVVVLSGRYVSFVLILRDAFYLGSLFISVKVYHQILGVYTGLKLYTRSITLLCIFSFLNTFSGIVLFTMLSNTGLPTFSFILNLAEFGALIGLGIGIGTDFYFQNKNQLYSLLNKNDK
jgi:hypothetical protein